MTCAWGLRRQAPGTAELGNPSQLSGRDILFHYAKDRELRQELQKVLEPGTLRIKAILA